MSSRRVSLESKNGLLPQRDALVIATNSSLSIDRLMPSTRIVPTEFVPAERNCFFRDCAQRPSTMGNSRRSTGGPEVCKGVIRWSFFREIQKQLPKNPTLPSVLERAGVTDKVCHKQLFFEAIRAGMPIEQKIPSNGRS